MNVVVVHRARNVEALPLQQAPAPPATQTHHSRNPVTCKLIARNSSPDINFSPPQYRSNQTTTQQCHRLSRLSRCERCGRSSSVPLSLLRHLRPPPVPHAEAFNPNPNPSLDSNPSSAHQPLPPSQHKQAVSFVDNSLQVPCGRPPTTRFVRGVGLRSGHGARARRLSWIDHR